MTRKIKLLSHQATNAQLTQVNLFMYTRLQQPYIIYTDLLEVQAFPPDLLVWVFLPACCFLFVLILIIQFKKKRASRLVGSTIPSIFLGFQKLCLSHILQTKDILLSKPDTKLKEKIHTYICIQHP